MRSQPQGRAGDANAPEHRVIDGFEIIARLELLPFQQFGDGWDPEQRYRTTQSFATQETAIVT